MREIRGLAYASLLTMHRQVFARKTLAVGVLVALASLATLAWTLRRGQALRNEPDRLALEFGEDVVMFTFVGTLTPILCLIYATAAIGEEREERTLVYWITRPLSRWRLYFAKGLGTAPVVLLSVLAAFSLVCVFGGPAGRTAFLRFLPGVALGSLAYTALFLWIGAVAPKPLVVSVLYAFLIESLIGNMPGTLKRAAISYHTKCILYDAGASIGIRPENPANFLPIAGDASVRVLWCMIALFLLFGAASFQRREYREL
jgi:ABC-2 type transport system permease protein